MNVPAKIGTTPVECNRPPVIDVFQDDRGAGSVIGTCTATGALRRGRDVERQIAIDHEALRFQPLVTPGWGRQGIAYGPFRRACGLVMAVSITNGHYTSQDTPLPEHIFKRIRRWAVGPNADPLMRRLIAWARGPRRKGTLRRFRWWMRSARKTRYRPDINENLAIGWFTSEAPIDPLSDGCGFIMHAALGENGELWTRVGKRNLSAFRRLKNLRICYFVALRERGAIYYAAAVEGAHGLAAFPNMRPIAIDPWSDDEILYAGVHQSVLGQIGFRVDTRVDGIHIRQMPEFASHFGTAHVGDRLVGNQVLGGGTGSIEEWQVLRGQIDCTDKGAFAAAGEAIAIVDPGAPSGLIHAIVTTGDTPDAAGIAWRVQDGDNHWLLKLSGECCALVRIERGAETLVARDAHHRLKPNSVHSLQILDSEGQIGCYLDGESLFETCAKNDFLEDATGTGIWFGGGGGVQIRDFEAHPRETPIPPSIQFEPHWLRLGQQTMFTDDFAGPPGELAGRAPGKIREAWERTLGIGSIDVGGDGTAGVRGTLQDPHPNRTFHTLPWHQPDFADLEVTITPPGDARGQSHRCRAGLVFWQDRENYLSFTTYLDDAYEGASVALFTKRHGFEELYDAVWTMLWDKVDWGKPFRLRIPCDGNRFVVFVDDEPVLERALTDIYPDDPPLRITRVGLAVNWEWGNDTGSRFQAFTARC